MSKKSGGISWIKKAQPKFIREFKERIAYKEQASVETKRKKLEDDLIVEREEDRPQVVQLKSGDLGETEYLQLQSKQDIENAASSFGKILFKKPQKSVGATATSTETATAATSKDQENANKKKTEIDLIFNLDKEGKEIEKEDEGAEGEGEAKEGSSTTTTTTTDEKDKQQDEPIAKKKKIYLDQDECCVSAATAAGAGASARGAATTQIKYGLQQPIVKPNDKKPNLTQKILSREAKAGNKKLLSFYNEEEEEEEEEEDKDQEEQDNS